MFLTLWPKPTNKGEDEWIIERHRLQNLMQETQRQMDEMMKAFPDMPFADDPDKSDDKDEKEKEREEGADNNRAENHALLAEAEKLTGSNDYWNDPHKQVRVSRIFKRLYPDTVRTAPLNFGEVA
jgi:hypothetical protein